MKHALPLSLLLCAATASAQQIEVVDLSGNPVDAYEVMWHTADEGRSLWIRDGQPHLPRDADVIDLIVRADGFASRVQRFEGESLTELRDGATTIVMQRGEEVRLVLDVTEPRNVPDDFVPQAYFEQFAWRVRMGWQPVNQRNGLDDFNMLNLKKVGAGRYSLRLDGDSKPFFFAAQHPGWLRFFEAGPLSLNDVADRQLAVGVPQPAALEVKLGAGGVDENEVPFDEASIDVYWPNPDSKGSVYSVTWNEKIRLGETKVFRDLGPGAYTVWIRTTPKDGVEAINGSDINPGRFFAERKVSATPGSPTAVEINWTPFSPDAVRGDCHAQLVLKRPDGSPAAGVAAKVQWFDGHYGAIDVFEGPVPEGGVIELNGVSSEVVTDSPYGPYSVELDSKAVGWFRLKPVETPQEFEFRMTPEVGDRAPNITIADVASGATSTLSDFRGQVVLLELWATWCGPCQPAMAKLEELVEKRRDWAGKVAVLPLSVDKTPGVVATHLSDRSWDATRHFWSAPADGGQSDAERAFVVRGVPTAILIDAGGKIAWRGHPLAQPGEATIEERIDSLLADD